MPGWQDAPIVSAWQSAPVVDAPPPQPTPPESGALGPVGDFGKNVATGLFTNAPAGIAGLPAALRDAYAQDNYSGSPVARIFQHGARPPLPSYGDVRGLLTNNPLMNMPDYVPSTGAGRIVQGAATGAGGGILGGPVAAAVGAAGGAVQQGGSELGLPPWLSAALGIGTSALGGGLIKGASMLRQPTTLAAQKLLAQKVLDEAAVNPNAPIGQAPIPGAPSTLGQATGDPGTLALEKQVVNSSPQLQGKYVAVSGGANSAVSNDLQSNFTWPGRGDAVPQMQQASGDLFAALQNARKASSANVSNLWDQVDPGNTTAFDTAPIKQDLTDYVGGLTKARSTFIPKNIQGLIDGLGPTEPLAELQDTRSAMLTQARSLRDGGNYNEANVVQGLADRFGSQIDNLQMPDPAMNPAYQAARQATKAHYSVFGDPAIEKALGGLPATAADTFLRTGTTGGLDSLVNATGSAAIPAAQDWFMGGLAKAAESATPGVSGGQTLLATPFTRYLSKYKSLLNDDRLFTPDQRDLINRAGQQLDYSLQTERAGVKGGSNTYSLLSSNKYLETMVGKKGAALLGLFGKSKQMIGTGVGGALFGTPGAMVGGAVMGGEGAGAYSRAAQSTLDLVHQAILDPKFAAELRAFRDNPTKSNMTNGILKAFTSGASNPTPLLGTP